MPLIYQSYIIPSISQDYVNLYTGDCTISVTDFDGDNANSNFELDAGLFTTAGQYVIIKSTNDFTNYVSASATWVGSSSLTISSAYKANVTFPNNVVYYCIVVNIV
jgi:hypothetical protein